MPSSSLTSCKTSACQARVKGLVSISACAAAVCASASSTICTTTRGACSVRSMGPVLHAHQPLQPFLRPGPSRQGHIQAGEQCGNISHPPLFDILDHRSEFGGNAQLHGMAAQPVIAAGLVPDLAQQGYKRRCRQARRPETKIAASGSEKGRTRRSLIRAFHCARAFHVCNLSITRSGVSLLVGTGACKQLPGLGSGGLHGHTGTEIAGVIPAAGVKSPGTGILISWPDGAAGPRSVGHPDRRHAGKSVAAPAAQFQKGALRSRRFGGEDGPVPSAPHLVAAGPKIAVQVLATCGASPPEPGRAT